MREINNGLNEWKYDIRLKWKNYKLFMKRKMFKSHKENPRWQPTIHFPGTAAVHKSKKKPICPRVSGTVNIILFHKGGFDIAKTMHDMKGIFSFCKFRYI